ncbi:hypothetical protein [Arcticibacter tournemirensis]|uniref:hypothetical protein n=1 Tax=Arcticibacter tournemirensis TaxID=699437 RepID=UPI001153A1F9|nr:hypothetical protein [Arcticibacter tournemirensis]
MRSEPFLIDKSSAIRQNFTGTAGTFPADWWQTDGRSDARRYGISSQFIRLSVDKKSMKPA